MVAAFHTKTTAFLTVAAYFIVYFKMGPWDLKSGTSHCCYTTRSAVRLELNRREAAKEGMLYHKMAS